MDVEECKSGACCGNSCTSVTFALSPPCAPPFRPPSPTNSSVPNSDVTSYCAPRLPHVRSKCPWRIFLQNLTVLHHTLFRCGAIAEMSVTRARAVLFVELLLYAWVYARCLSGTIYSISTVTLGERWY